MKPVNLRKPSSVSRMMMLLGLAGCCVAQLSCGPLPKNASGDIMDRPDATLAGDVPITPRRLAR